VSIQRILGNGYSISTSYTVLGPRQRNIDEYWLRIYKSGDLEVCGGVDEVIEHACLFVVTPMYADVSNCLVGFITIGGTGERVGRGGRGRGPRRGNDERVDELNGQGNDQGMGANGGVEGVIGNVEGVNGGVGGAPDFSMIIAQQLQNLLPAMLAQVGNQGNVGNQNGNVVNENVQDNVGNVLVNGNQVGCSYKEFLACNPKEYDGKGGAVVLTRWIEKMESIRTLSREVAVSMSWNDFKFMIIEEFCPSHEMKKLETELWNHTMVGVGHAAYTDRFHELARRLCTISGALDDEEGRIRVLGPSVPPATPTMHLEGLVAHASTVTA
ncbi:reverse transcriptase domain-containing protein, partial [Tanacetum coccineum]